MRKFEQYIQSTLIKIIDFFYKPFAKFVPHDFFCYGFAGGLNMLLDWFLYFIIFHFVFNAQIWDLGFVAISPHIASFIIKFPIIFLTGFWLNRHISFTGSRLMRRTQLFRYLIVVVCCIIINYVCLKFFVEICEFYPTPSNMLTTVIATIFSYFSQKYFTFKK